MSLSRTAFDRIALLSNAPPCPLCSFAKDESPGIIMDLPRFPTFIAGRRSGIVLCSDGCRHASAMIEDAAERGMPFGSVAEAEKCWALLCERAFAKVEQESAPAIERNEPGTV